MTCERTKKQRIRFLGTPMSECLDAESRRLAKSHPELTRDRVMVAPPMWICGTGRGAVECDVHLCDATATHECDGCDMPICSAHATRKGMQEIIVETTFEGPGWRKAAFEDTYDLCPFCLFNPESMPKRSTP